MTQPWTSTDGLALDGWPGAEDGAEGDDKQGCLQGARAGLLGSLDTGQLSVWRSAGYNHRGQGSPFGQNIEMSF